MHATGHIACRARSRRFNSPREIRGQIAERLSISHKTVRNHVTNIYGKLHVSSRGQAIVRAREAGMGQGDDSSSD